MCSISSESRLSYYSNVRITSCAKLPPSRNTCPTRRNKSTTDRPLRHTPSETRLCHESFVFEIALGFEDRFAANLSTRPGSSFASSIAPAQYAPTSPTTSGAVAVIDFQPAFRHGNGGAPAPTRPSSHSPAPANKILMRAPMDESGDRAIHISGRQNGMSPSGRWRATYCPSTRSATARHPYSRGKNDSVSLERFEVGRRRQCRRRSVPRTAT